MLFEGTKHHTLWVVLWSRAFTFYDRKVCAEGLHGYDGGGRL